MKIILQKNKYTLISIVLFMIFILHFFIGVNLIPQDFSYHADIVVTDTYYDPIIGEFGNPQDSVGNLLYSIVDSQDGILTIEKSLNLRKINSDIIFDTSKNYLVNQKDGQYMSFDNIQHNGYLFAPGDVENNQFTYWDIKYDTPVVMSYVEDVSLDDLHVKHFQSTFKIDRTDELNYLQGVPEYGGVRDEVTLNLWIEPVSSHLVKYDEYSVSWYYNQDTGEEIVPQSKSSWMYTNLSYEFNLSQAKKSKQRIVLNQVIDVTLFVLGVLFAFVPFLHRRERNIILSRMVNLKKIYIFLISFFVLLGLLLVTFILWYTAQNEYKNNLHDTLQGEVESISSSVQDRLRMYIHTLVAGKSLFLTNDAVTRNEWRIFIEGLDLKNNFPGIQGVGYSKYISREEIDQHINSVRDEGFPEYTIHPETNNEDVTSIVFLEPFDFRNKAAFGLDMLFEENRRTAMEQARDTGNPVMSGRVLLVQEIDDNVQAGFLIYIPIYKNGYPVETIEQRRSAIIGYVYSPFRMGDFMAGVLDKNELLLNFSIHDGISDGSSDDGLMYKDHDLHIDVNDQYVINGEILSVGEHNWTIYFNPKEEITMFNSSSIAFLIIGCSLSFLISLIVYLLLTGQSRALLIAKKITSSLNKKNIENHKMNIEIEKMNNDLQQKSDILERKVKEVELINKHLVGRELKMIELKRKLNQENNRGNTTQ